MTTDDLPDQFVVVIKQTNEAYYMIYYGYKDNPNQIVTLPSGAPMGRITIGRDTDYGPCGGAMKVGMANAGHGWGPLLYDIAIEFATQIANGLIADRESVSEEAEYVWRYYMERRSDVKSSQLDDFDNYFTPEEEDNCDQSTPMDHEGPRGWMDSPLSKRYTKEPTTINSLKVDGKLVML
tara:strand:- start:23248 stop:23787 length:540 start_codon:yes stop_codon:yes gene_type:complete